MKPFKDIIEGGFEGVLEGGTKLIDTFISSPDEKIKAKIEFRALLQDYEVKMQEQANRELELQVQERANARAMQIAAINQSSWLIKHFTILLSVLLIFNLWFAVYLLVYIPIPTENKELFRIYFDFSVISGVAAVLNFWLGSSIGSKQKTDHEAINKQMETLDSLTQTRFDKREQRQRRKQGIDEDDL